MINNYYNIPSIPCKNRESIDDITGFSTQKCQGLNPDQIFETLYPGMGRIIPYFWMPRYVDAKDASARTLDLYDDE